MTTKIQTGMIDGLDEALKSSAGIVRVSETNIKEDFILWGLTATITTDVAANTLDKGSDAGFENGDRVQLETTGTLPAGLVLAIDYYVVGVTTTTLQLAASFGGAAIDLTDVGTGVHTLYVCVNGEITGPMIIEDGVTVTIKDGCTLVVV